MTERTKAEKIKLNAVISMMADAFVEVRNLTTNPEHILAMNRALLHLWLWMLGVRAREEGCVQKYKDIMNFAILLSMDVLEEELGYGERKPN